MKKGTQQYKAPIANILFIASDMLTQSVGSDYFWGEEDIFSAE